MRGFCVALMLLPFASLAQAQRTSAPAIPEAKILLRAHDPNVTGMRWVALDSAGRPIGGGDLPAESTQSTSSTSVTYCAEDDSAKWLSVTVDLGRGQMNATGRCTRVTLDGKRVRTEGVVDPRSKRHAGSRN
jgi:hypothetical protein